ncbi:MAG: superoxide dismutase family protein [Oscillospiraceae bacterium]
MWNCPAQPDAVAYIRGGDKAPSLTGEVQFYQKNGSVLVVAHVSGLPQSSETGFFAFHIHEGGSCSGESFSDTGGHYNPAKAPHPNHAGDLPPLMLCHGGAYLAVRTDRFSVRDILGRTVVIHSGPDDFRSQPAGNAGNKIACGVIRPTSIC